MDESSRESQTVLERILGVSLSLQAIEPSVADAAGDVTVCYAQPLEPGTLPTGGAILVVPAEGTGVVEGARGHLVNDRMEPSGMRWTNAGAQAVRDLRAVRLNGPWDAWWQFHRHQPHHRLYGTSAPAPERAEAQALTLAA